PEVPLPELRGRGLAEFLLKILAGVDSRQAWERLDLPRACLEALPPEAAALLSRELPGHVVLQAGRRVRVHYPWGREPWIESRLQDFFGMKEGPKLAGGRVPLLLHLLAPNQRAVQVTKDLAGFWKNTYPEIRKQLMRRYPKHRWPEDAAAVGAVRERPLRGKA
ncbi:ATP-dependent helicase HrpB, partial [bacterium]